MGAVILAKKTVAAIDAAIKADQGGAYRQWLGQVIPHMDDAYRGADDGFRSHMGGSLIGGECGRAIWYGFRWATKKDFEGRLLRLFNRGHLEEARFIAMLLTIGVQVFQQDANGKQFRISEFGGHFGGAGDGVGVDIPDLQPGVAALLEFKTHNDNSFKKLKKEGVRAAKLEHFVQMQVYMRKMNLPAALYLAVNKNDDELYGEIVLADSQFADTFIERAGKLITMRTAPDRISNSPGWFACSWCDHKPICHLGKQPERNCRTCQWAEPNTEDGKWWCRNDTRNTGHVFDRAEFDEADFSLSKQRQLQGCEHYVKDPSL